MFGKESFAGQVALVTGGGTGIGRGISQALVDAGATVVIASRRIEVLDNAAREMDPTGEKVWTYSCDIRLPGKVKEMIERIVERYGKLDILVNNAAGNFIAPVEMLTPNGWKVVVDIVLNGTYYCSHYAGLQMLKQQSGKILNVIATYAWTGNAGTAHSASAKAGVLALTRSMAVEWGAQGIRVNAIAPGPVDTSGAHKNLWDLPEIYEAIRQQVPMKRFAAPEEIANAALFLVAPEADYINGEVLTIDGGMWLNRSLMPIEQVRKMAMHLQQQRDAKKAGE